MKFCQEDFAKRLRLLMAKTNTRPTELAKRANVSAVMVSQWSRLFKPINPSAANVCALADALGTTPDVLLGYKPINLD